MSKANRCPVRGASWLRLTATATFLILAAACGNGQSNPPKPAASSAFADAIQERRSEGFKPIPASDIGRYGGTAFAQPNTPIANPGNLVAAMWHPVGSPAIWSNVVDIYYRTDVAISLTPIGDLERSPGILRIASPGQQLDFLRQNASYGPSGGRLTTVQGKDAYVRDVNTRANIPGEVLLFSADTMVDIQGPYTWPDLLPIASQIIGAS